MAESSSESEKWPSKTEEAIKNISSSDRSVLDASLTYMKELFSREEQRRRSTESKANTLLGFSGLTSSLILGLGKFLFDLRAILPPFSLVILIVIYIAVVAFLIHTIGYSLISLRVTVYSDAHPMDIYKFQSDTAIDVTRKWIANLLVAYHINSQQTNEKVTNLTKAQKSFTIGIGLLLLLATFISLNLFFPIQDC